jgi:hypothetical protein
MVQLMRSPQPRRSPDDLTSQRTQRLSDSRARIRFSHWIAVQQEASLSQWRLKKGQVCLEGAFADVWPSTASAVRELRNEDD